MQSTFQVYSDPGHGWVKVPKSLLVELGIADKITNCSYMENQIDLIQNIMKDSDIPARTPDYRLLQSLRKKFWKVRKEVFGEVSKK